MRAGRRSESASFAVAGACNNVGAGIDSATGANAANTANTAGADHVGFGQNRAITGSGGYCLANDSGSIYAVAELVVGIR
jgi:hypothetical protein